MKIEWAPWFNVPMHCRLEVLGVAFLIFCAYFVGSICFLGLFYSLVISIRYIYIQYEYADEYHFSFNFSVLVKFIGKLLLWLMWHSFAMTIRHVILVAVDLGTFRFCFYSHFIYQNLKRQIDKRFSHVNI